MDIDEALKELESATNIGFIRLLKIVEQCFGKSRNKEVTNT